MTDPVMVERLRALMLEHLHLDVPAADTDLLDSGLLDSLQLVDLLLLIEQHLGRRIDIATIDLENLRSLARLAQLLETAPAASPRAAADRDESDPEHGNNREGARRGVSPSG